MILRFGRKAALIVAGIADVLLLGWLVMSQRPLAPTKVTVDASAAQLAAAQRDRDRALADVAGVGKLRAQARLASPVDGVVSARLVEPGTTLVAGQAVLQVIDPASLWIKARIDQGQAGAVRVGQPVEIVLRSDPRRAYPGKVERIDWVSDAVTEERIVNVGFADRPKGIPVGELVEVTIRTADLANVRSVPAAAVKRIGRQDGVWQVSAGRGVFRPVKLGFTTLDGRSQIVEGLNVGADLWVVQRDTLGPYAEPSSVRDDAYRALLGVRGVAEAGNLVAGRPITRSHYEAIVDERARTAANPAFNRPGVPGLLEAVQASQASSRTVNVVMLRLAPYADETVVAREIRRWKHLEAYTRADMDEILIAKLIATSAKQIFMFLVILAVVSAAIVAFIIYTMTLAKVREIAVLKLIGARNRTIAGMILQQAPGLGVIGFVVGRTAAALWAPIFPKYVLLLPGDAVSVPRW